MQAHLAGHTAFRRPGTRTREAGQSTCRLRRRRIRITRLVAAAIGQGRATAAQLAQAALMARSRLSRTLNMETVARSMPAQPRPALARFHRWREDDGKGGRALKVSAHRRDAADRGEGTAIASHTRVRSDKEQSQARGGTDEGTCRP